MRRVHRFYFLVGLGALALSTANAADRTTTNGATQPQNQPITTIQVTSQETVVDVIVTDAKGEPVRGLTRGDFTVKENGKDQIIDSFAEHDGVSPSAPIAAPSAAGVFTNQPVVGSGGPLNIVLLDAVNVPYALLQRERMHTVDFLKKMPAGTTVAIFALSGKGLMRLSGFTQDRQLLMQAANITIPGSPAAIEPDTRAWWTAHAMEELASFATGVEGRKNLIWFTSQMPIYLLRDGGYGWHLEDMTAVHMYMDAFELLTRAQVAVSPVDVRGVVRLDFSQLLMEETAKQTGGFVISETNAPARALSQMIEKQSHYYTISYVPPRKKDDGHFHAIHVDVDRPGLQLKYRSGYDSEDPLSAKAIAPGPGLKDSVAQGRELAGSDLHFLVYVHPVDQVANGKRSVVFEYVVPPEEIAAVEAEDAKGRALDFEIAAYARNGRPVQVLTQRVTFQPHEDGAIATEPFRFTQQVDVPPGPLFVQVGLMDPLSKKIGRMEIPLVVDGQIQPGQPQPKDAPPAH